MNGSAQHNFITIDNGEEKSSLPVFDDFDMFSSLMEYHDLNSLAR